MTDIDYNSNTKHMCAKPFDPSINDAEFHLAIADMKGRKFRESCYKFERMVKATNSHQAWCGLGLSKLGLVTDDSATVNEAFYCFETAKKLNPSDDEVDDLVAETTCQVIIELAAIKKMSLLAKNKAQQQLWVGALVSVAGGFIGARKNASLYSTVVGAGTTTLGVKAICDASNYHSFANMAESKANTLISELENAGKNFLKNNESASHAFISQTALIREAIKQFESGTVNSSGSSTKALLHGTKPQKSKIVAGILALLFGCYGAHKFYLGYIKEGIIQFSIGVFCAIGGVIGAVEDNNYLLILLACFSLVAILGYVEGIIYLTKNREEFTKIYIEGKRGWF